MLRPGTKVLGRPEAAVAMSTSRVNAVSLIAPSTARSSTRSWPSFCAQCGNAAPGRRKIRRVPQFGAVALAIVEADRFHAREPVERPGQASGGVLAAGKQNECRCIGHFWLGFAVMTAARWQGGGPASNFGAVKKFVERGCPSGTSLASRPISRCSTGCRTPGIIRARRARKPKEAFAEIAQFFDKHLGK